jgi:hypothetical protein
LHRLAKCNHPRIRSHSGGPADEHAKSAANPHVERADHRDLLREEIVENDPQQNADRHQCNRRPCHGRKSDPEDNQIPRHDHRRRPRHCSARQGPVRTLGRILFLIRQIIHHQSRHVQAEACQYRRHRPLIQTSTRRQ